MTTRERQKEKAPYSRDLEAEDGVRPRTLIAFRKAQGIRKITLKAKIVKGDTGNLNHEGRCPVSKMMISPNFGQQQKDSEGRTLEFYIHEGEVVLCRSCRSLTITWQQPKLEWWAMPHGRVERVPRRLSYIWVKSNSGNVKGAPGMYEESNESCTDSLVATYFLPRARGGLKSGKEKSTSSLEITRMGVFMAVFQRIWGGRSAAYISMCRGRIGLILAYH
ncbi:hypothetical protein Tco_0280950 [Tanacetum coccineum]